MGKNANAAAVLTSVALGIGATIAVAQAPDDRVSFPANYATKYSNYLSVDRQNGTQIMRIFANDIAMQGPGEDGRLANGAILVGELYPALTDADGNVLMSELGRMIRGDLAAVAVMEKQEGWGSVFPDEFRNGDWDFAIFTADGQRRDANLDDCRGCHAPLDDRDHVFSFQHLPGAI
jgi:hypothetical protein